MRQVMYIGPDIKGIVRKNDVYTYVPEAVIEQVAAVYDPARQLFIPMDNIVEEKKSLSRTGSALNLIYSTLEKKTGGRR